MKSLFTKLCAIVIAISLSSIAFGQTITNVTVAPTQPTSCTPTLVTVDATQLCINYLYKGASHTVNGSVIDVTVSWETTSPICLGALAFVNPTESIGPLSVGTYTLNVMTTLDGVVQQTAAPQTINVISCCGAQAAIQTTATNICVGDSVTFTDNSTGGTSAYWSQNGSSFSTSNAVTVPFPTAGTYPIVLTSSDSTCSDSTTVSITVNDYPTVNLGPDVDFCIGQSITIDATNPIPGVTYAWNSLSTAPFISVSNPGTYVVTVDNNGCTSSDDIVVSGLPSPSVSLGADMTICDGTTTTLDANINETGAMYSWSGGDTTSSITVNTTNTYTVTVTNASNCSATDDITVTVEALPMPNLGPDTTICDGATLELSGISNGAINFAWNTGATSSTLTVDSAGMYSVTSTTLNGCSGTDDVMVSVETLPVIDLGGDTTICEGSTLMVDATTTGLSSYTWNTGATSATITVDSADTYSVTGMTVNGCMTSANIMVSSSSVMVDLGDTIDISANPTVTLDAENPGATYSWSTGATTQTITVSSVGTYTVTVTNALGCSSTASVVIVNSTSTHNLELEKVNVFPNPAQDYLIVENDSQLQSAIIINAVGQIVKEVTIQNNNKIDVSQLTNGMYFLQLQNIKGESVGVAKFMKH